MADNSSIAFEIYKTIIEKQNNLIENNMIKEEDIIDITENDFINNLQQTINGLTIDIEDSNIVSAIYTNILKKVDKAESFFEVFSKEDMEISADIVKESIKEARNSAVTTRQEIKNPIEDAVVTGVAAGILLQELNEAGDYNSQLDFYNSLSRDEQIAVSNEVYTSAFGERYAEMMSEYDTRMETLNENVDFVDIPEDVKRSAKKTFDLYDPLKNIADELGFSIESIKDRAQRTILTTNINSYVKLVTGKKASKEIIEACKKNIIEELGLTEEEAVSFFENLDKKIKEDPEFLQNMSKLNERLDINRKRIERDIEEIRKKLTEFSKNGHIPSDKEIRELFLTAYDENGRINYAAVCVNLVKNSNLSQNYDVKNFMDFGTKDYIQNQHSAPENTTTHINIPVHAEKVCLYNLENELTMSVNSVDSQGTHNRASIFSDNSSMKFAETEFITPNDTRNNSDSSEEVSAFNMDDLTAGFKAGMLESFGVQICFEPSTRMEPVTDQEYSGTYRSASVDMAVDEPGLEAAIAQIEEQKKADAQTELDSESDSTDTSSDTTSPVQNDNEVGEGASTPNKPPVQGSFIMTARREDSERDTVDGEGSGETSLEDEAADSIGNTNNSKANFSNFKNVTQKFGPTTDMLQEMGNTVTTKLREQDSPELANDNGEVEQEEIE